jgi:hypothetical protein
MNKDLALALIVYSLISNQSALPGVWKCNRSWILNYFLFENILKYYFFYFLKFIFDIRISKQFKNTRKIFEKKIKF